MSEQPQAPAGWYDDGPGIQRWWDGTAWTEHVHAPSPEPEPEPEPERAGDAARITSPDALRAELLEALQRLEQI